MQCDSIYLIEGNIAKCFGSVRKRLLNVVEVKLRKREWRHYIASFMCFFLLTCAQNFIKRACNSGKFCARMLDMYTYSSNKWLQAFYDQPVASVAKCCCIQLW